MLFRMLALAPRLHIETAVESLGAGRSRVTLTASNRGYLPTHVLDSARPLTWNEPLWATVQTTGCTLQEPRRSHVEVGHLDGWGRGRFDGGSALYFTRSSGSSGSRVLTWVVEGSGTFRLTVGSCRIGEQTVELAL
jgi:hypothetical protein